MAEKKQREDEERSNIDAQANMWNMDKKNWEVEESRLKARIDKINKENQDFLLKQMADKQTKKAKMNPNEFAFNKQLLRDINQKMKTNSVLAASVKSGT